MSPPPKKKKWKQFDSGWPVQKTRTEITSTCIAIQVQSQKRNDLRIYGNSRWKFEVNRSKTYQYIEPGTSVVKCGAHRTTAATSISRAFQIVSFVSFWLFSQTGVALVVLARTGVSLTLCLARVSSTTFPYLLFIFGLPFSNTGGGSSFPTHLPWSTRQFVRVRSLT